jgi:hypothetical protein
MKYGPNANRKFFGLGSIFLIISIIVVWVASANTLFITRNLGVIADKVIKHLGISEQTSLNEFSDIDDYIKGIVFGITTPGKFPAVDIKVKQKNILILNSARENGGKAYVPATLSVYDAGQLKDLKSKIRSKGDRQLHKESFANMSLRVNMKGDDRLFGLEEFSVQDPMLRGYTWELLVAEILKSEGLLTLQSKVATFSFNGESRGLYVFEEVPSKITVERNLRKSGPIFGLNEDYGTNLDSILDVYDSKDWEGSQIYTNARENLLMQFAAVRGGGIFSKDIFDLDEWARYFALIDLFGTYHGTVPKSVKFYYNPVIGKFQPLLFDAHKGVGSFANYILADFKLNPKSVECDWICSHGDFYTGFLDNEDFFDVYLEYLEKYSRSEFIKNVENVYMDKFEKLDQKFYASLSRSDGIFFRGFGLYFFKFSEIERRRELLNRRVDQLHEHKETFAFWSPVKNREPLLSSKNEVSVPEGIAVVTIDNQVIEGTAWEFKQPTVVLLSGDTVLKGRDKDSPLNISGPVMLVQEGGTITLDNVSFIKPINIDVSNRQWSGAVNIINAKADLGAVLIEDSNAEDAINFINSTYEISDLMISGSKSDAVDFDFSSGYVDKISCFNIGNDCVDASESKVVINALVADDVQDKGVSAGENSIIKINVFDAKNVAVGLVSKDGSELEVDEFRVSAVQLAISAYKKKPEYSSPSLIVKKVFSAGSQSQIKALVSNNSKVEIPDEFNILIEKSNAIESRMYGVEFGKATEK